LAPVSQPPHSDLLASEAGQAPTLLPSDPAAEVLSRSQDELIEIVCRYPASSLCWALLADETLIRGTREADVVAYAYARTGYHRGLDALRRAGWRGSGPIPWEHEPNQGFLRALHALAVAAGRIGETVEQERCAQFLRDSSEMAYEVLTGGSSVGPANTPDSSQEPQ
jgi:Protein of unknown function (DUF3151)